MLLILSYCVFRFVVYVYASDTHTHTRLCVDLFLPCNLNAQTFKFRWRSSNGLVCDSICVSVCVCVSPNCLAKRQCCCGSSCDIKCVIDVNLAPQLSPSPTSAAAAAAAEAAGAAPLLTSPNVCWSSCFIFIPITSCSQQKTHTRTYTYTNRSKVGWLARTLSWFVETTVNLCFEFAASFRPVHGGGLRC